MLCIGGLCVSMINSSSSLRKLGLLSVCVTAQLVVSVVFLLCVF